MYKLTLTPGELTLKQLRAVSREGVQLSFTSGVKEHMQPSIDTVANVLSEGRVVYGINTGFGLLANTRIDAEDLETLQRSIVLSHAAGIGTFMDDHTVRLMMVLKINSLARGYSGIRFSVVEALATLINADVYPCIPKKGSVGASGDLAPLAHMSTVLLGEGQARHKGEIISGAVALKIAGLEPITLGPKEGLALLNGTQASTAFALEGLFAAEDLY
ncbi:aromatic amino acid lyase, partial [Enterovibrio norvegicus]